MSDYVPTTEEVEAMLSSYLHEYGIDGVNMNELGNSPDEIVDRWLAEVRREAAEKALTEASAGIDTCTTAPSDYWRGHLDGRLNAKRVVDGYASAEAYRQERKDDGSRA